jgi:hypothetical protein
MTMTKIAVKDRHTGEVVGMILGEDHLDDGADLTAQQRIADEVLPGCVVNRATADDIRDFQLPLWRAN